MATHSSVLAWRIPGTGEPGGLPSMGSHRVRHDLAAARTLRMENTSHQTAINPYCEPQGHSGCEIHRTLAPDSWDAYESNDCSEPRHLLLPIHRRVLNSSIWDIYFSLINNNLFDIQTTCPLLKTLVPAPISLETVLLGSLVILSPRLEVLTNPTK